MVETDLEVITQCDYICSLIIHGAQDDVKYHLPEMMNFTISGKLSPDLFDNTFYPWYNNRVRTGVMSMHDELTKVDIRKMQEEIDYRKSEVTPKLKEQLKAARDLGDLSENDEYHSVKRALNKNYGRIRYLQAMIDTAVVIDVDSADDVVGLFDKVTVYDEEEDEERVVSIVTTLRNDIFDGYISKESPFGRAILGHKVGDRVEIKANEKYSYYVVIRHIEKGEDNESLPISSY